MAHSINILGKEISTEEKDIDIDKLLFYVFNPRIYSKIQGHTLFTESNSGDEEKQKYIQEEMLKEQSVINLKSEIVRHGGLTEPILVKHTTYEVIEGNSRLAVYRKLRDENPEDERWHTISCRVVTDLDLDQTDAYLHGQHVEGKTPWTAYDKAHMAYKRIVKDGKSIADYAETVGATENEIKKQVNSIQLMYDNDDKIKANWSYYDLIVRNQKVSNICYERPDLKEFLLEEIKNQKSGQESFKALELRDKFPTIVSKPKVLKKFVNRQMSFEDAYHQAKSSKPLENLMSAKASIEGIQSADIQNLNKSEINTLLLQIKRCRGKIDRLKGMVEKANGELDE